MNIERKMEMEHNAKELYSLYDKGYAFPKQSITYLYGKDRIDSLGPLTRVYYDSEERRSAIEQLVERREPCNIGMEQCFNAQKFERTFGWGRSYYYTYFQERGELAPNIGIYCYTPVFIQGEPLVHIYNAIALAFDDKSQPDYIYYIARKHRSEIADAYVKIFYKIFVCAEREGLEDIVFSLIGAGAFSTLFPKFTDVGHIYVPALLKARKLSGFSGRILFMGSRANNLEEVWTKAGLEYKDIGYFPENLKKVDLSRTLFVNAWDPHSFAGNGNASDSSLDGFIGRVSAIALLCSPLTNFYLKYQPVEMPF